MEDLQPKIDSSNGPTPLEVEVPQTEGSPPTTSLSFQDTMQQMLQPLLQQIELLNQSFDTKLKYDESKERQVDMLHRELQSYREGLHFKTLRPLFIDLIAVHDDIGKLIENMSNKETTHTPDQTIENLHSFQETIEEILQRHGVESYNIEGEIYVPSKQRVLQVINTNNAAEDKQIARRIRKGFEYDGRVLRPELIATFKMTPGKE